MNLPDDGPAPVAAGTTAPPGDLETRSGNQAKFWAEHKVWLLGLFLIVLTICAYGPVWHAGFIWDDDEYVTHNPLLTAPDGLRRIWFSLDSPSQYFPLTYTTFYFERLLWGFHPLGYHLVNVLGQAVNALLVWRLLTMLRVPGAWVAAAVFALHPVQVESVAWVTERKNVLMGFFYLLSVWAWLRFTADEQKPRWGMYALSLALFALALFAKTTACTLPFVLLLLVWFARRRLDVRRVAQVAPYVLMGLAMGLVTMWWERYHQGTAGKLFSIGLTERILIASHALWFYLGKLVWPVNLTFSYPHWDVRVSDPRAWGWLVLTLVAGGLIWRNRELAGRGLGLAAAFFALTLGPVLGFIMLYTFKYTFVADHYQYLACLGPIALGSAIATVKLQRFGPTTPPFLAATLLLILTALTWNQCESYADIQTLWQATIARNPDSWMARGNLGNLMAEEGRLDEGIQQMQKALELHPDNAEGWRNLGLALARQGRGPDAVVKYNESLKLEPDSAETHVDLGNVLAQMGQGTEAILQYQRALVIEPGNPVAQNNLGNSYLRSGQFDEAILHYEEALKTRPHYPEAENNLGACYYREGRLDEAVRHYQKAVDLMPDYTDARVNLANALLKLGQTAAGLDQFRQAAQRPPPNPRIMSNLAWLLSTCPDPAFRNGAEALTWARRANDAVGPGNPNTLHTLATALAETGQYPEAVRTAEAALALANAQSIPGLADQLEREIKLYQAGQPFHVSPSKP